jgi:phosphoglycolate phosphatase
MNLNKFFTIIVGARDNIPLKPKPNMLLLAMEGFKTTNKMFYMVGDTSNDIDAAKAANIKSIVVEGGYTNKDVKKFRATHTLKNMKDIIKLFGFS